MSWNVHTGEEDKDGEYSYSLENGFVEHKGNS